MLLPDAFVDDDDDDDTEVLLLARVVRCCSPLLADTCFEKEYYGLQQDGCYYLNLSAMMTTMTTTSHGTRRMRSGTNTNQRKDEAGVRRIELMSEEVPGQSYACRMLGFPFSYSSSPLRYTTRYGLHGYLECRR